MPKLPDYFFVSSTDGALHDTRKANWQAQPLRPDYCKTFVTIRTPAQLRATLRAGAYAWPGGYPLYFVLSDGESLSFESARAQYRYISHAIRHKLYGWRIVACAINWEDDSMLCAHSGKPIESAYGSPEQAAQGINA